uniref:Uncharacterized protein n=1 Tax=Lactuca sativa TaxID=4236 RepID=A0A9R1VQ94_LACSA|nr:hypothetical protein LSAT_V11C400180530 [Lactuca sativa]
MKHWYLFLTYNFSDLSSTNLPELKFWASDDAITIKFGQITSKPNGSGSHPKGAWFDLHGQVNFTNLVQDNQCLTYEQGHFSIIVESRPPPFLVTLEVTTDGLKPMDHEEFGKSCTLRFTWCNPNVTTLYKKPFGSRNWHLEYTQECGQFCELRESSSKFPSVSGIHTIGARLLKLQATSYNKSYRLRHLIHASPKESTPSSKLDNMPRVCAIVGIAGGGIILLEWRHKKINRIQELESTVNAGEALHMTRNQKNL